MAEVLGCRPIEIDNMDRKSDPMRCVIVEAIQKNYSLHQFIDIIDQIKRKDVLMECQDFISK